MALSRAAANDSVYRDMCSEFNDHTSPFSTRIYYTYINNILCIYIRLIYLKHKLLLGGVALL